MFNKKIIKEDILKINNKYETINNGTIEESRKLFQETHAYWGNVFLDKNGVKKFNSIVKKIKEEPIIKNNFTEKEIKTELRSLLNDYFSTDSSNCIKVLDKKLEEFYNFFKEEIKEWTIYIPILNLELEEKFLIGNVELLNFDSFKEEVNKLYKNTSNENKKSINNSLDLFKDKVIAKTTIKGTKNQFKRHAFKKIRLSLNLLNFYKKFREKGVGLYSERNIVVRQDYVYFNEDYKTRGFEYPHKSIFSMNLTPDRIQKMKKENFNKFNDLLLKLDSTNKKLSNIEENILISLFWYGESVSIGHHEIKNHIYEKINPIENLEHVNLSKKFIFLAIALEKLLNFNKYENISENISERIALLIGKDIHHKFHLKRLIKNLYEYRSNIVHGSDSFITKKDLKDLEQAVKCTILNLLKIINNYNINNTNDLRDLFNIMKFEGKSSEETLKSIFDEKS
jgi:hypothetical protein